MNKLTIHSISYTPPDVYEVVFRNHDQIVTMHCTIIEHAGTKAVQPTPDLFITGLVPYSREVCAAVLAFHQARRAGEQ